MAVHSRTHDPAKVPSFYGLSTDPKPLNSHPGATFLETDTQKEFLYAGAAWVRDGTGAVEVLASVVLPVKLSRDTDSILEEMLVQQKIQNAHLAEISGDVRDEADIPAEVR